MSLPGRQRGGRGRYSNSARLRGVSFCSARTTLFLAAAAACLPRAAAFIYPLSFSLQDEESVSGGESGVTLSEGPMFASFAGPFGGRESYVSVAWAVSFSPSSSPPLSEAVNVHVAVLDSATRGLVGRPETGADGAEARDYCCTAPAAEGGGCGDGVGAGGLVRFPPAGGPAPFVVSWTGLPTGGGAGGGGGRGNATAAVTTEGPRWLLVVVCDAAGLFDLPPGRASLTAAFRNPEGFLPGTFYGMLPWTGALAAAYALCTAGYAALACARRRDVIGLQLLVLGVLVMGCLESAVAFGMYLSKNATGVPTPCNVCATTPDFLAAVVLGVLKRAVSRGLLLAVARGYGVVHAALPLRTTLGVAGLSLAYTVFGALNETQRETSYGLSPSAWELPVLVIDLLCLLFTQSGLAETRKALGEARQVHKRRMYDALWRVILSQVAIYVVVEGVILAVRTGAMPFPWKSLFFLVHFWDLLYLVVLLAIAYLWRPGPDTAQYAYYAQANADAGADGGPDSPPDDDEGGGGPDGPAAARAAPGSLGIEMTAGAAGAARAAGGVKGAAVAAAAGDDAFVIDDDEEDGDLSRGGGLAGAGAGKAAAAPAPVAAAAGARGGPGAAERDTARLAKDGAGAEVDTRTLGE